MSSDYSNLSLKTADKLKINRSRIGSYEEARSEPSIETLIQISECFSLPVDILIKKDCDLTVSQVFSSTIFRQFLQLHFLALTIYDCKIRLI